MPVPNTFGTATSAIPLSQLDANFATPITIGNTAVQLGNTVTTLNNMTLANVTISSGTITITNVAVTTANVSGTANVNTLVVVGNETVGGNTTVSGRVVLSGGTANGVAYLNGSKVLTTGSALVFNGSNFALGVSPSTNSANTSIEINKAGNGLSVFSNTDFRMSRNVYDDGTKYARSSETAVTYILGNGTFAWYNAPTGTAGAAISFTQLMNLNANGALGLSGASTSANGVGITFPATQSASTDANTLDDYEEGTWTPAYSVASGSIAANSSTSGKYTKIGRVVYIWGYISYQSNSSASGTVTITGLPFTSGGGFGQSSNRSGGVYTIGNVFFGSNSPNFGNIPAGGTSIEPLISTATGGTGLTFANFNAGFPNSDQFAFAGQYTV